KSIELLHEDIDQNVYICNKLYNMTTVRINKNANKVALKKALSELEGINQSTDYKKYIGKIKFAGDPVEFQRDLR
ncbi:MAG: hypothetical protein MUF45_13990, partial [Spirosomaceae bacterium]|nr:hypothetical protein [Spirosomataceae bacterium]